MKPYTPINCAHHDWIEHCATLKNNVRIKFKTPEGAIKFCVSEIETWEKHPEGEFLILKNHITPIRMDHILSVEGKDFD